MREGFFSAIPRDFFKMNFLVILFGFYVVIHCMRVLGGDDPNKDEISITSEGSLELTVEGLAVLETLARVQYDLHHVGDVVYSFFDETRFYSMRKVNEWVLMDGRPLDITSKLYSITGWSNVPDLTDRYLIGASDPNNPGGFLSQNTAKPNATVFCNATTHIHSHTLSGGTAEIISSGDHTHSYTYRGVTYDLNGGGDAWCITSTGGSMSGDASHTHSLAGNSSRFSETHNHYGFSGWDNYTRPNSMGLNAFLLNILLEKVPRPPLGGKRYHYAIQDSVNYERFLNFKKGDRMEITAKYESKGFWGKMEDGRTGYVEPSTVQMEELNWKNAKTSVMIIGGHAVQRSGEYVYSNVWKGSGRGDYDQICNKKLPIGGKDKFIKFLNAWGYGMSKEWDAKALNYDVGFLDGEKVHVQLFERDICFGEENADELFDSDDEEVNESTGLESSLGVKKKGGLLEISIISAHDLIAADRSGTSDPYIVLTLQDKIGEKKKKKKKGNDYYKTKTVKKTLNPRYNEKAKFVVSDMYKQHILLQVYDWDFIGKDDFLGDANVSLKALGKGNTVSRTVYLSEKGHVKIELKALDFGI